MNISRQFSNSTLAVAALAVLGGSTGCSLLVRAVKGEVTPIGVDSATSSDVRSLGRTLAQSEDPKQLDAAFSQLTSVYLYKCLNNPTKVPKDGKAEIRVEAGQVLVAGMKARLAKHAPGSDAAADGLNARATALSKEASTQCDADKLAKFDGNKQLDAAIALTTSVGRERQAEIFAQELEPSLEEALADESNDYKVRQWTSKSCPAVLDIESYCIPHALVALHQRGRWATIADGFAGDQGERLNVLVDKDGAETITSEVREFLFDASDDRPQRSRRALDAMTTFLQNNDAYGDCKTNSSGLSALVRSKDVVDSEWALDRIVEDGCNGLGKVVIKAMANDSGRVRAKAAWAVGELGLAAGKKHVYRLRWNDPDWDVRDAAAAAYNKLELEES